MRKLIVIIGPTGSNKTTLAHLIAKHIGGEIINGDVFQMYKEINIGINKPSLTMMQEIKYHLINNLSITDKYSIYDYQNDFANEYNKIIDAHKIPILCGGSHLYIDCIIRGYSFNNVVQDEYQKLDNWSTLELENYLKVNDYESYLKFRNNHQRLQRTVALLKTNHNQKKSDFEIANNVAKYQTLVIMTNKEKQQIYDEVDQRTLLFLKNNWAKEVLDLFNKYGNQLKDFQAMKAIGYSEILNSIIENREINITKIQQKTRHLVKHQLTWCNNKFTNKLLFNFHTDNLNNLLIKIKEFYYD